ncbi:hypothetical protein LTR10_002969 [Elasticomyces elasticus]|nr:hypothetical protein LTR10_002969 [Elasticomyces elasticus]KAK4967693.1 hypothetical protein LTR42_010018 [Elasticomyces elasticus]
MATLGKLTRSGMLYEGNYDEWEGRMQGTLEMHNIAVCFNDEDGLYICREELTAADEPKATTLITNLVSEGILGRISDSGKDNPENLLDSLRDLAKPFRLNDLPPELRERIYSFHFAEEQVYLFSSRKTYHTLPSLLLVSCVSRLQALPIFYRDSKFLFSSSEREHEKKNGRVNHTVVALRQWAKSALQQGVRDLRRLCVCTMGRYSATIVVTLDVLNKKGLMVTFERETRSRFFTAKQKQAWRKHIEQLEADRQALGLLGEALILAFTTKPELWERPG